MKRLSLLLLLIFSSLGAFAQTPIVIAALDSCNFESPCDMVVLDSISSGIWQIGQPHKIIFDSAYSPVNAIVTDTINPYSINQNCHFEVLVPDAWEYQNLRLSFKHKFNTDTLIDGGFLEVSDDGGNHWENIINTYTSWQSENIYSHGDSLLGGQNGFSGNSNGWITSSVIWYVELAKGTGVDRRVRFHFVSDSIETHKDGWMIDNLYLEALQVSGGIDDVNNSAFSTYPNPAKDFIQLNFNDQSTKSKTISIYNLLGQEIKSTNTSNSSKIKIDVSELKKGFYILKLTQENQYLGSCKWQKI